MVDKELCANDQVQDGLIVASHSRHIHIPSSEITPYTASHIHAPTNLVVLAVCDCCIPSPDRPHSQTHLHLHTHTHTPSPPPQFTQSNLQEQAPSYLSLIHISEPTRLLSISYAVFCLKKKKK
eukprot:TRINITY_DN8122_c0_g1_i16.p1 TRINITY_DN8122_c0_g1~~TRINITY_DN8122_c0_g1_i16.p1  ORF type:complete len:123 (-),score=15.94 TRINITY_DN8122_c0_g1_i16:100-468(-)